MRTIKIEQTGTLTYVRYFYVAIEDGVSDEDAIKAVLEADGKESIADWIVDGDGVVEPGNAAIIEEPHPIDCDIVVDKEHRVSVK